MYPLGATEAGVPVASGQCQTILPSMEDPSSRRGIHAIDGWARLPASFENDVMLPPLTPVGEQCGGRRGFYRVLKTLFRIPSKPAEQHKRHIGTIGLLCTTCNTRHAAYCVVSGQRSDTPPSVPHLNLLYQDAARDAPHVYSTARNLQQR